MVIGSTQYDWEAYSAPVGASEYAHPATNLVALNGLKSLGREAWPLVRRYVWLSTYAGDELFAGYSQPLVESDADALEFHLLIDREAWSACEPAARQDKMYTAQAQFEERMSELNLTGSMHVVLTSR